ncbi:hypothetical protein [Paraburkholderia sp. 32]|uniref:hypothetical protein n=1 Tax=Paraburkholderia sp. 32 TaxID=2991057 RepID=UPI003D1B4B32
MYRGFNLKIENKSLYAQYEAIGRRYHENNEGELRKKMTAYLKDGVIDATAIQNDWFGEVSADVFISHSHADRDLALSMSGWMREKYGLSSFVDSSVWGHADDLLREIDNEFCLNAKGDMYDYESRNRSTSHVHMMLSTALSTMIDRAECVIFLNTPQSIVVESAIKGHEGNRTGSPWIYAELVTSQLIRKRAPRRVVLKAALTEDSTLEKRADSAPPFLYEVDKQLDHLTPLGSTELLQWEVAKSVAGDMHALDVLYRLKPGK